MGTRSRLNGSWGSKFSPRSRRSVMRAYIHPILVLATAVLLGATAKAQVPPPKLIKSVGPLPPTALAANADAVIVGKVTEIESDAVEVTPYKGAPADQKVSFKVGVLKIDEAVLGASGLTRIRVG